MICDFQTEWCRDHGRPVAFCAQEIRAERDRYKGALEDVRNALKNDELYEPRRGKYWLALVEKALQSSNERTDQK